MMFFGTDQTVEPKAKTRSIDEKRNPAPRVETNLEVPYWKYVKYREENKTEYGFVKNISITGFFIETDLALPPGMELGFEFYVPTSAQPLRGKAIVMWVRSVAESKRAPYYPPGMGLEFVTFEEDSKSILEKFISSELLRPRSKG